MKLYFCGLDQFNCLTESKERATLHTICEPLNQDGITKACMRFDLVVFQKIGHEPIWFVKGLGVPNVKELFPAEFDISEVCMTSKGVVGLNCHSNSLYKVDFIIQPDNEHLTWNTKKVPQPDPAIKIKQIVSDDEFVYALDDLNGIYQIDENFNLKWRLEEIQVVKIASGFGHFIALSDTGALFSWGCGGRGELGHAEHDHAMVNCEVPKRIEFFDDLPCIVKDISCGGWHTLALTSDGDVYSWGWNESGQLGHSTEKLSTVSGQPYPIDLGSADDPITQIAAGARHSIILLNSGKVFSTGLNKYGQLGVGDLENKYEPVEINYKFNSKPLKAFCGRWCTFIYGV